MRAFFPGRSGRFILPINFTRKSDNEDQKINHPIQIPVNSGGVIVSWAIDLIKQKLLGVFFVVEIPLISCLKLSNCSFDFCSVFSGFIYHSRVLRK